MPVTKPQPQLEDSLFAVVKPSKLKVWYTWLDFMLRCALYSLYLLHSQVCRIIIEIVWSEGKEVVICIKRSCLITLGKSFNRVR